MTNQGSRQGSVSSCEDLEASREESEATRKFVEVSCEDLKLPVETPMPEMP